MISIDATVNFSFKGETYNLTTTIDLDNVMQGDGHVPNIHLLLARQNDIDTYSYLYAAMESHPVRYSNANGIAIECLIDDRFDQVKFYHLWHENKVLKILQGIASEHLNMDDLEQQADIKTALMAAYEAGKQHPVV